MFNSLEHKFQNNRARDRIHNEFVFPPRQGWLGLKKACYHPIFNPVNYCQYRTQSLKYNYFPDCFYIQ
ncbi:hypothetical protein A6J61_12165 [Staphylococcus lugdunensis]|nr:hypothetical protein A6J61_12165 [Staphylococcus lugdunensis]PNZ65211.1 hypothetical protein CD041_05960 [Staphylococcus lugdunensis]QEX29341.1 hypothetical protein FO458_08605 [Staphylococcus lugdunensis]QEX34625.1 hypothetical protein FO456_11215 [Staphylococcus lugdunensis]